MNEDVIAIETPSDIPETELPLEIPDTVAGDTEAFSTLPDHLLGVSDLITPQMSYEFLLLSFVIFVTMTTLKWGIGTVPAWGKTKALNVWWVKLILGVAPGLLGAGISVWVNFFSTESGIQVLVGLVCGYFSDKVVYKVLAKVAPDVTLSDKSSRRSP